MGSNKRTIAIIGASVLMLGFILPVVSIFGLVNLSYFDLVTKASARFATGIVILALGGLSLALALKNNFKPLIGTGIVALAILAFDFVTYKTAMRNTIPTGQTGSDAEAPAQFGEFADQLAGIVIQPAWGMFVMAAAAILLIVAGAMKDKPPVSTDWNRPPPPPMNYS